VALREVAPWTPIEPVSRPGPASAAAEPTAGPASFGHPPVEARILVLDDDAMVRDTIGLMLTSRGYAVDCAAEGGEAIALFTAALEAHRRYDAVILDLTIAGGMGGLEVAERLARLDPEVKAIVASGSTNHPLLGDPGRHGFAGRLDKPFRTQDLLAVLKRVLK
jgi:CheY-like chemotaxis protein